MRLLIFGASITHGYWDTEGGWAARLRKYYDDLQVQDFSKDYPHITELGIAGDTTATLINRFDAETKARNPAGRSLVIVFAIGTNNALVEGGKTWSTPERYQAELDELVNKAKKYTDKIMFVGLTPCDESRTKPVAWGDFTYTNDRIWQIEQAMRAIAGKYSMPHIPVYETFTDRQHQLELFADGLHPNNAGHEIIADLVRPELERIIGV
jgi:lysophospholipase L1-like esterase